MGLSEKVEKRIGGAILLTRCLKIKTAIKRLCKAFADESVLELMDAIETMRCGYEKTKCNSGNAVFHSSLHGVINWKIRQRLLDDEDFYVEIKVSYEIPENIKTSNS